MAANNISHPKYSLSTRIEKGYTTKIIPFFFCSVYIHSATSLQQGITVIVFVLMEVSTQNNWGKTASSITSRAKNHIRLVTIFRNLYSIFFYLIRFFTEEIFFLLCKYNSNKVLIFFGALKTGIVKWIKKFESSFEHNNHYLNNCAIVKICILRILKSHVQYMTYYRPV